MSDNRQIASAVRRALLMSALAGSASLPAQAQDEAAPPDDAATVGAVVVTGSRIKQPNLTSISPVTAVSSETVKLEGVTRVEDLINNLPQAFADFGGNLSNGATGAATVNLRGLGSQRTLVLVNGRRLMPGDPQQNGNAAPDLNQIPASMIERIEVLTGGASAVYGADAVAGVVNFIMNDDFEGVRLDAQYGFYQHDNSSSIGNLVADSGYATPDSSVRDGYSKDITFLMGMNTGDGRGNATVYVGYRDLDALLQSERDFSACSLASGDEFACIGSSTTSPARFQAIDNDPASPTYSAEVGQALTYDAVTGVDVPYVSAQHAYNFAPLNHFQRPDERYTAGLFAHYDLSEKLQAYTEFQFMNDETFSQIAPSGMFRLQGGGAGGSYIVNCDNPFLTAAQLDTFCTSQGLGAGDDALVSIAKRNVEGGGRQDHLQHTSYRAVIGGRGDLTDAWSYDVYGQYGTTEFAEDFENDVSRRKLGNALLAVDDGAGNIVCRVNADADPSNDDPGCVPYNPFTPNGVTQAALGYVQAPGFSAGSTTEMIVSGSITGDLGQHGIRLPTAASGLAIAIGAEYRSEESEQRNDVAFLTGDLLGQGGAQLNIQGEYDVSEAFIEARLPIAQDKAFAQAMSLEAGYRYSDYSLGFTTDTYKVGADWAPVEDIRFRGSFQRAVRAPNVVELFRPQVVQLDGNTDPCAVDNPGVDTPSRTLAECQLTGVTAAQYGLIAAEPAAQYNGLTGGNPVLNPESSDTVSFGFVLTPRFLDRFSLAVDYFDIKVDDLIGTAGADVILNNCLNTGGSDWCSLIHRAPGSGALWGSMEGYVIDTNINTGSLQTKGIDVEANYRLEIGGAGKLSFQLIGTMVDELVVQPVTDSPTYDCAGLYGLVCGVPAPEFRSKFRTTWLSPWNLDLTFTWRHIDAVDLDSSSDNPQLAGEVFPTDAKLDAVNYLDLAAAYTISTEPATMTFRLGINNLTDEDPTVVGQDSCPNVFCSGNTFPQVYDTLGRTVFLNVTADF
jgi:outer membrane receptor protein involved in Fe transport